MIATARLRYLGVSAQKTRLVVDLVRGKTVGEALATLRYSRKMVAKDLEKLLQSAVANAQQKDAKLDVDRLVLSRATVDDGPPQKRARARSMGRIYRILKRSSHVSFGLEVVSATAPPAPKAAAPKAGAGPKKAEAPKKRAVKKAAPKKASARR
jgi:large subunit ribosomal protein L22